MRYPSDNFYHGHSLSFELGRSGKREYQLTRQRLVELGLKPTPQTIHLSLQTIRQIHNKIRKDGKNEQKKILDYKRKKKLTGDVIPIDLTLAYDSFNQIVSKLLPYIVMGNFALGSYQILRQLKQILNEKKSKNPIDKQIQKMVNKIVTKDTKKIIVKNITEIIIQGRKDSKKRKYKKSNKSSSKIKSKQESKK
ncbi:MAG: hypothetical protein WEB28_02915 [Nitrosopumilaceae archaeon]